MKATFKLLNTYFWKTVYGPVLSFLLPVIFLVVLGKIFRIEYVYPGIIAMSFLFINMFCLPLAIMEIKQSFLFKYIGSTTIKPVKFSGVTVGFYALVSVASLVTIIIFTMVFYPANVFPQDGFKYGILGSIFRSFTGFCGFVVSATIHLVFVVTSGVFIAVFSKTAQQCLTISIVTIIPSIFLSGMVISVDIIAESDILNWVSRLIPYRYSTGNMIIATTPLDQIGDFIGQLSTEEKEVLFTNVDEEGNITFSYGGDEELIESVEDLVNFVDEHPDDCLEENVNDIHLYDLVFEEVTQTPNATSDNNIFNVVDPWSVRRLPETTAVENFITQYLVTIGETDGADVVDNLMPIVEQIESGNIIWLDIFLKQVKILYYPVDRILNFGVPIVLSLIMIFYLQRKFLWSTR